MTAVLKVKQFKDTVEFEKWQDVMCGEEVGDAVVTQIQVIPVSMGGSATEDGKFGGELTFCISIVYFIKQSEQV